MVLFPALQHKLTRFSLAEVEPEASSSSANGLQPQKHGLAWLWTSEEDAMLKKLGSSAFRNPEWRVVADTLARELPLGGGAPPRTASSCRHRYDRLGE